MRPTSLIQVLSLFLLLTGATFAVDGPPNVVLIFADDLGYGDVGCYGATKVRTPNIDRLASEGRRFMDAHSVQAVCTPSRYALLTGQYPVRANDGKGVWGPAPTTSPLIVDTETTTVADVFKNSGYDTAVIGKWHLGFGEGTNKWKGRLRPGPQDLGFDYYFGMPVVNSAPPYVFVEKTRVRTSLSSCTWRRPIFITRSLRPNVSRPPASVGFMATSFTNLTGSSARFFRAWKTIV